MIEFLDALFNAERQVSVPNGGVNIDVVNERHGLNYRNSATVSSKTQVVVCQVWSLRLPRRRLVADTPAPRGRFVYCRPHFGQVELDLQPGRRRWAFQNSTGCQRLAFRKGSQNLAGLMTSIFIEKWSVLMIGTDHFCLCRDFLFGFF